MISFIIAIISGIAMSVQGVFNTRLQEKIGMWEATTIVQGTGFILSLILLFFLRDGSFKSIKDINKLYLLGGLIGVLITWSVIKSVSTLSPTVAISTILIAQLLAAGLIDKFGLFGSEKLPFGFKEIIGIFIMIVGVLVFKWKT